MLVPFVFNVTPVPEPLQTVASSVVLTTGSGLTVTVKLITGPVHVPFVPVTVIVPIIAEEPVLIAAVKAPMFPEPPAAKLINGLLLIQVKVSPPPVLAVKLIAPTVPPEQTTMFGTAVTTGEGSIVIVNVFEFAPLLVQPDEFAVTVMVPVIAAGPALTGAT